MDNVSRERRVQIMRAVKQKNTKPEVTVRKYLHRCGLRFRIHDRKLPGKPDIVLSKHRAVIFVNGCFWHGHVSPNCNGHRIPKTNTEFWRTKITLNRKRDQRNKNRLESMNWRVFEIWECQTTDEELLAQHVHAIVSCECKPNVD